MVDTGGGINVSRAGGHGPALFRPTRIDPLVLPGGLLRLAGAERGHPGPVSLHPARGRAVRELRRGRPGGAPDDRRDLQPVPLVLRQPDRKLSLARGRAARHRGPPDPAQLLQCQRGVCGPDPGARPQLRHGPFVQPALQPGRSGREHDRQQRRRSVHAQRIRQPLRSHGRRRGHRKPAELHPLPAHERRAEGVSGLAGGLQHRAGRHQRDVHHLPAREGLQWRAGAAGATARAPHLALPGLAGGHPAKWGLHLVLRRAAGTGGAGCGPADPACIHRGGGGPARGSSARQPQLAHRHHARDRLGERRRPGRGQDLRRSRPGRAPDHRGLRRRHQGGDSRAARWQHRFAGVARHGNLQRRPALHAPRSAGVPGQPR